jgi:predicted CopG family antitoxin
VLELRPIDPSFLRCSHSCSSLELLELPRVFTGSLAYNTVNTTSTYNIIMAATKRIPVSEEVWAEISELKRPGQTFDDLLSQMAEQEKKRRFIEDMDRIEAEGDFVELEFDVPDTD